MLAALATWLAAWLQLRAVIAVDTAIRATAALCAGVGAVFYLARLMLGLPLPTSPAACAATLQLGSSVGGSRGGDLPRGSDQQHQQRQHGDTRKQPPPCALSPRRDATASPDTDGRSSDVAAVADAAPSSSCSVELVLLRKANQQLAAELAAARAEVAVSQQLAADALVANDIVALLAEVTTESDELAALLGSMRSEAAAAAAASAGDGDGNGGGAAVKELVAGLDALRHVAGGTAAAAITAITAVRHSSLGGGLSSSSSPAGASGSRAGAAAAAAAAMVV